MPRTRFSGLKTIFVMLGDLFRTFRNQKITIVFFLALIIFALSLVFAFLSYTPILSPFIYPLF